MWTRTPRAIVASALVLASTVDTLPLVERWTAALKVPAAQLASSDVAGPTPWWHDRQRVLVCVAELPDGERQRIEAAWGRPPAAVTIVRVRIAVIAQARHPILARGLSLAEVDAAVSGTRNRRHAPLANWTALVPAPPAGPIRVHLPDASTGVHGWLREHLLQEGDFAGYATRHPGSAAVVAAVGNDPGGLGCALAPFLTDSVGTVPVTGEATSAASGADPLLAPVVLLFDRVPEQPPARHAQDLLRFLLGPEGQRIAAAAGYVPLDEAELRRARADAGIPAEAGEDR